jgi:uncharacterized protein (DUF1684 family)
MKKNTLFLLCFLWSFCIGQTTVVSDSAYKVQVEQWHQNRVKSLKSETGWLNIVGLHWLKEGNNTFGSGKENSIIFPTGKATKQIGTLTLKDGIVILNVLPDVKVEADHKLFTSGIVFDEKQNIALVLAHKNLKWFIIKRGDKYAIRLRDFESEALKNFTHIDRFPVDSKWKVVATLEAAPQNKTIPIHDVIGLTTETPFGGILHFEIDGKKFQLEATLEGNDLFIVFSDKTTGKETYGGGRFLYAEKPATGNIVILDFNKAYNPPCCFTNFATCPLPRAQNHLSIPVSAGEKTYGHH